MKVVSFDGIVFKLVSGNTVQSILVGHDIDYGQHIPQLKAAVRGNDEFRLKNSIYAIINTNGSGGCMYCLK